jgi:hypothetical protein
MKILVSFFGILLAASTACAGFVTVGQEGGVWWFKSPEGKPFVSLGANHVEPIYWQSPNNTQFVAQMYGADLFAPDGSVRESSQAAAQWAQRVAQNFAAWGFNTLGFHNPISKSLQSAGTAYYVIELALPVSWGWNSPRSALVRAFRRHPLDVFGNEFAAAVEANAAAVVKSYVNDPRVLGYAYTDGPPWTVDDDTGDAAPHLSRAARQPRRRRLRQRRRGAGEIRQSLADGAEQCVLSHATFPNLGTDREKEHHETQVHALRRPTARVCRRAAGC